MSKLQRFSRSYHYLDVHGLGCYITTGFLMVLLMVVVIEGKISQRTPQSTLLSEISYPSKCISNIIEYTCIHDDTDICSWCRNTSICVKWNQCTKKTYPYLNCTSGWITNSVPCTGTNFIPVMYILVALIFIFLTLCIIMLIFSQQTRHIVINNIYRFCSYVCIKYTMDPELYEEL